ncbi:recQ-mediated genome instability protein 2 isoform 2-T2 [Glossophaga mutica]
MAAAVADSFSGGSPAAVRLPSSPPVKVLAEQLRRNAEGSPGAWRLSRAAAGRGPLKLTVVWMQGTVVAAGGGEARLRDPSGAFSVCGLERVPRGRPCLAPGEKNLLFYYKTEAGKVGVPAACHYQNHFWMTQMEPTGFPIFALESADGTDPGKTGRSQGRVNILTKLEPSKQSDGDRQQPFIPESHGSFCRCQPLQMMLIFGLTLIL